MKRSILPLLSMVAASLFTVPPVQASPLVEMNFSSTEGYQAGDLAGQNSWTTPDTSGIIISSGSGHPVSPVGSDQLLIMSGPASGSEASRNELIFTETPLTAPFILDIWMMRSSGSESATSTRDSYINITSQSSLGNGAFAGFDNDRFFYQKIGNDNFLTEETYVPNTWYRFHLEIDPAASGYSLTIYDESGATVVDTLTNLSFRGGTAVQAIDVLRLNQLGGSTRTDLYVGGITVIPEPSSLAFGAAGIGVLGFYRAVRRRKS